MTEKAYKAEKGAYRVENGKLGPEKAIRGTENGSFGGEIYTEMGRRVLRKAQYWF